MLIIMLLTILLSYFITDNKMDKFLKIAFRIVIKMLFVKVQVDGIEQLDKNENYVFIPNHQSFFDGFTLHAFLPVYLRGIEIDFHFNWFIYGKFLKIAGNIPINPNSLKDSLLSIKKAAVIMKSGKSYVIFPEGKRSQTGEIGTFKRLPFMLAQEAKASIVPVALIGFQELMPVGTWRIKPRKVIIRLGDVIKPEKVQEIVNKEIVNYTRNEIINLYKFNKIAE